MSTQLIIDGNKVYDSGTPAPAPAPAPTPAPAPGSSSAAFRAAVQAAWDADSTLDWRGGDVTLSAPIFLNAPPNKYGFGLRGNGARITPAFAPIDAAKHAINIGIPVVNGVVPPNVIVRNFEIVDFNFRGSSFAGAVKLECLSNTSWMGGSFLLQKLKCEGHNGKAFAVVGSVFEGIMEKLTTTGGQGALWVEKRGALGTAADPDMGLPSALYLYSPNFRDGSGNAIELACPAIYNEPFDLTIRDGYIVSYGGSGLVAPAGITTVDGTGFEFTGGGSAMKIGYRGGLIKNCRGANPVANATPTTGMKYLVDCALSNNRLVLEDCGIQNEGSGSGARLARISGAGTVVLNRSGLASVLDGSGPSVVVTTP